MAQRGGSVVTHIRLSDSEIYSPLIPKGRVNILLLFEPLEALRYMDYLNRNSILVVNKNPLKIANYPDLDKIIAEIDRHENSTIVDALEIAKRAGNILTQNIVLLGIVSKYLPLDKRHF